MTEVSQEPIPNDRGATRPLVRDSRLRRAYRLHGVPGSAGVMAGLGTYAGFAAQMPGSPSAASVLLGAFSSLVVAGGAYGGLRQERRRRAADREQAHQPDQTEITIACIPQDQPWATWIQQLVAPWAVVRLRPSSPQVPAEHGGTSGHQAPGPTLVLWSVSRLAHEWASAARNPLHEGSAVATSASTPSLLNVWVGEHTAGADPLPPAVLDLETHDAQLAAGLAITALVNLGALPRSARADTTGSTGVHAVPFPGSRPRHVKLPSASPGFIGRSQLLTKIHRDLALGPAVGDTRAICLWGLGGVGKTSLALEYAYRYRQSYDVVWWVRAETQADLRAGLVDLARELGIAALANTADVLELLVPTLAAAGDVLLVLDNAEPAAAVEELWPHGDKVNVLMTSRLAVWADRLATVTNVHVPLPSPEEAQHMLLGRMAPSSQPVNGEEATAAAEIAEELGLLPLALDHAAAYVRGAGASLVQYRSLLNSSRQRLLTQYQPAPESMPLASTWNLSLRRSEQECPGASTLMAVCSVLAPDDIPRALLHETASAFDTVLGPLLLDSLAYDRLVRTLSTYSLLQAWPTSLSVHRMVQVAVRSSLSEDSLLAVVRASCNALLQAYPATPGNPSSWPLSDRLSPHVEALAAHARQLSKDSAAPQQAWLSAAELFIRCAAYQIERASNPTAEALLQVAVALGRTSVPEASLMLGRATAWKALALYGMADYPGARREAEAVLATLVPPENPAENQGAANAVVLAAHTLARTLIELSELDEALRRAEDAHALALRATEASDSVMANWAAEIEQTIGIAHWRRGEFRTAIHWLESALRRSQAAGDDARKRQVETELARVQMKLGELLDDTGALASIRDQLARSIQELEPIFGPHYRHLLARRVLVGESALLCGDTATAAAHLEAALSAYTDTIGIEHPDSSYVERLLGFLYCTTGRPAVGFPMLDHALEVYQRLYGTDHPYVAEVLASLGVAQAAAGQPTEAEASLRRALTIDSRCYQPNHPKIALACDRLALLLESGGRSTSEPADLRAKADRIRSRADRPTPA